MADYGRSPSESSSSRVAGFATPRAVGDDIAIRPVLRRHAELLLDLNGWLLNALGQANSAALEEVNAFDRAPTPYLTGGRQPKRSH